jgi:uncharacterized protein (TIGR02246 family)
MLDGMLKQPQYQWGDGGKTAMRIRLTFGMFCLALLHGSCDSSKPNLDKEQQAVLTAERGWAASARQRDLERSVSFMADDAVMFPPAGAPIVGKAAIRKYMASGFATPGFSVTWDPQSVVVADSGDFAYTQSRSVYTVPGPDGATQTVHAKGVAIWRKSADGKWRCVVDIWNEAPPPSQGLPSNHV